MFRDGVINRTFKLNFSINFFFVVWSGSRKLGCYNTIHKEWSVLKVLQIKMDAITKKKNLDKIKSI